MFDRVAARYDVLNSVMSAGFTTAGASELLIGPRWGRAIRAGRLLRHRRPRPRAGLPRRPKRPRGRLRLLRADARSGAGEGGAAPGAVRFEWADALRLPYDAGRFDAVTVGFGVRNLADLDRGLREMARVLRPGGRLVILEITQPRRPPLSTFYSLWFDRIVPEIGNLSGDPEAYAYLPESVRSFPDPHGLATKMDSAGLERIRYTVLAGGIIAIHSGLRG